MSAHPRHAAGAAPRSGAAGLCAALIVLLAGCASTPRDGPPAAPPSGLERVPDAVPRIEPIRVGGPNKPYTQFGRRYVPLTGDAEFGERGLASWYGRRFHGRPTASGEPYDMYAMTAAHKTMPLPSYARVRNPANGREVVVRVNDRGPFADGRVIDLSYVAALRLGVLGGVAPVEVRRITHDEIRRGGEAMAAGRGPVSEPTSATAAPKVPLATPVPVPDSVTVPVAARAAEPTAASSPPPDDRLPAAASAAHALRGFWLQLGAFRDGEAARGLHDRLLREAAVPGVAMHEADGLHRVQVGPYPTRQAAVAAGAALAGLGGLDESAPPLIVERR